jgi:hypothetical protein
MYKFYHIHSVKHIYGVTTYNNLVTPSNIDFTNDDISILVYFPADSATRYHLHNLHEYSETNIYLRKQNKNKPMNTAQVNNSQDKVC